MNLIGHFYKPANAGFKNRRQLFIILHRELGYISQASMNTSYGRITGYDSHPWAGSFVDACFHEAGIRIPSCVYPPSGLAEFLRIGRFIPASSKPTPGDIVFLTGNANVNGMFGMPGVGIVSDASRFKKTGQIGTIEGQTVDQDSSKLTADGVYRRVRSSHEIIGYGRPDFSKLNNDPAKKAPSLSVTLENVRPPRRNADIGLVQQALRMTVGLRPNVTKDLYDQPTKDAYAHWQRIIGYTGKDVTGIPDLLSLTELGRRSLIYRLSD
jgi:hypothetical protein